MKTFVVAMLFAAALRAEVAEHDLHITIDPDAHLMSVTGTITLPAVATERPFIEVKLRSDFGALHVDDATMTARENDGITTWRITPALPSAAKKPIVLRIAYRAADVKPSSFFHIGPEGSLASAARSPWYPSIDGVSDRGRLSFTVPEGITVIAYGRRVSALRFVSDVPATFWFAAAKYNVVRRGKVAAYLLTPRASINDYLRGCSRILGVLAEEFGPYAYGEFSLIEVAPDVAEKSGGWNAFGAPGAIVTRGRSLDERFNLAYFAHELGHQWWGNLVTWAGGTRGDYLLDEAMAQFSSMYAVEKIDGAAAAARYRRTGYPGFHADPYTIDLYNALGYLKLNAAELDHRLVDLPDAPSSDWIARSKGGLVWSMLAHELGAARFRAALRRITHDFAQRPITLAQFVKTIGAPQWFTTQWLERTGAPNFQLEWKQAGNVIRGEIVQTEPYYRATLDVAINDEMHRVVANGARTTFEFPVHGTVRVVTLDPEYRVLRWTPEYRAEAFATTPYTKGRARLNEGDYKGAEEAFRAGLQTLAVPDPFNAGYLLENGMGIVAMNDKRWAEARVHLEAAIARPTRLATALPLTYQRLARVFRELQDDAAACRAVENATSADAAIGFTTGVAEAVRPALEKCRAAP
jgi:tetratricopeptide (TPR) repeat protein